MENNFWSMFKEDDGKWSGKRWIAITVSAAIVWGIVYAILRALSSSERLSILIASMVFVLVLVGLARISDVLAFFGKKPNDETKS